MDRWYALRSVGTMLPGDHAWLSYSCREEQEHVIGAFVRDGLFASDKVIYITDGDPLADLRLPHALELDRYLRTGQLAVLSPAAVFDPGRMMASLRDALGGSGRFRGVRVTSDMTWAIHQPTGRDQVLDCEERLDAAIAPSTTAMAICQVDERSCTPDELTVLKERHEVLVGADPEFDDGVLTITRTFRPRGLRLAGELDGARHCWFEEALRAVLQEGGEVHLDMAGLRFIDLGALSLMAGVAMRMGASGRIIIDRPSPDVTEVVKLVGGLMLPWLEIRDDEES